MAEMIVVKHSLKTVNKKCNAEDLRKSVGKHVFSNLYKLLQVGTYYGLILFYNFCLSMIM